MRRIVWIALIGIALLIGWRSLFAHPSPQARRLYQTAVVAATYPAAVADSAATAAAHHDLTIPAMAQGRTHLMSWQQWTRPGIQARYRLVSGQGVQRARYERIRHGTAYLLLALVALVLWRWWRPLLHLARHTRRLRAGRSAGSAGWGGLYVWWRLRARRRDVPFSLGRIGPFGLGPRLAIRERDQARNAILWGPPGYGKTRLIVENILRLSPRHKKRLPSLTFTDSKGSLYAQTAGHLARLGYRVVRIDWLDPTSDGYNPLDPSHIQEPADAFAWAASLLNNTGRNSDTPFWDDTTTLLLVATVLTLKADHGTVTPRAVQEFLSRPIPQVKETLKRSNDPAAREAAQGALSYMEGNERLESSVFSGPPLKFMALWDERIRQTTSRNSVAWADLADPTKPPVAVFVTLTPGYEQLLRPFVGALFDQMNTELLREASRAPGGRKVLPRRVLNWWDEAGTIGKIADLAERLNTTREAGIGTVLGAQSTTQFDKHYSPEDRKLILEGCYAHLVLPGLRAEQADAVAHALGETTVARRQGGVAHDGGHTVIGRRNEGANEAGRPLLTADEVRRLWSTQLIAIVGNLRPVRTWWAGRWYAPWHPVLRRRGRVRLPQQTARREELPPLPATGPTSDLLVDWEALDG